jgi:putative transposase
VPQTLNDRDRQHEVDVGMRDGISSDERARIKDLELEVKVQMPCCPQTPARTALRPGQPRWTLMPQIKAVRQANIQVYGADKVWHQMNREGTQVACCTVERLMKRMGLHGVRRGKVIRTTVSDKAAPSPQDRVNRQFKADRPNQLWVSDFTYVSTWQGWQYVAFVIDVFARRIVAWRVSSYMRTDFVLDALEQALFDRQPERSDALIHHSDRGSQYVSILYTERLAQAGIEPSVGSRGDSYDNALAETINGLYKAELIHRRASWKNKEALELATLECVA